jgi:hypothetical protein
MKWNWAAESSLRLVAFYLDELVRGLAEFMGTPDPSPRFSRKIVAVGISDLDELCQQNRTLWCEANVRPPFLGLRYRENGGILYVAFRTVGKPRQVNEG